MSCDKLGGGGVLKLGNRDKYNLFCFETTIDQEGFGYVLCIKFQPSVFLPDMLLVDF